MAKENPDWDTTGSRAPWPISITRSPIKRSATSSRPTESNRLPNESDRPRGRPFSKHTGTCSARLTSRRWKCGQKHDFQTQITATSTQFLLPPSRLKCESQTTSVSFQLTDPTGLEGFPGGLNYTFQPVRDYVYSFAKEVVGGFEVDGLLLNYMRWRHRFPRGLGRQLLDQQFREKSVHLILGVMVPQTLDECQDLGYDMPTWIQEGLIDMVCPCDRKYSDFNAPYEQFSALTREPLCHLYPTMIPFCAHMTK